MTDKPYDPAKVTIRVGEGPPIEGPFEIVSQCKVCKSVNCLIPIHDKDKPAIASFTIKAVEQNKELRERIAQIEGDHTNRLIALKGEYRSKIAELETEIKRLKASS